MSICAYMYVLCRFAGLNGSQMTKIKIRKILWTNVKFGDSADAIFLSYDEKDDRELSVVAETACEMLRV